MGASCSKPVYVHIPQTIKQSFVDKPVALDLKYSIPDQNPLEEPISVEPDDELLTPEDFPAFDPAFVAERQEVIDNQSHRRMVESWSPRTLAQLVELLSNACNNKSALEKHWIIFYWIALNISYDTKSYFSGDIPAQSAENTFQKKTGVCAGYSFLYKYLCDQLNLECEEVSGYAKGYGYFRRTSGEELKKDHAWNMVIINKHKYLLDSTWGSGHLDEKNEFKRELKPFFFLTRPEQMIYDHLPEDARYQLLKTPITESKYIELPKTYDTFFEMNLVLVDPIYKSTLEVSETEHQATVIIAAPPGVALMGGLENEKDEEIEGGHQVYYDRSRKLWICKFSPNTTGNFKACIYAKNKSDSGKYSGAVMFIINAKSIPKIPVSYPSTHDAFYELGLELLSPKNSMYLDLSGGDSYGQALIKAPDDVVLIGSLKSEKDEKIQGGHQVYYDRSENTWICHFAPNLNGLFKANIYAKNRSDSGDYSSAVTFIINAKNISKTPVSYPEIYDAFYKLGLELLSPKNSMYLDLKGRDSYGEALIKAPDDVVLIGSLKSEKDEKIQGGHQVYHDRSENAWICRFAPNVDGLFKANIYAKKKSDSGKYSGAVMFIINARSTPKTPVSYPRIYDAFYELGLELLSPKNSMYLNMKDGNIYETVLVKAPDDVALIGGLKNEKDEKIQGGHQVFYDRAENAWICKFHPNSQGRFEAHVYAKKISAAGDYSAVVTFIVNATSVSES